MDSSARDAASQPSPKVTIEAIAKTGLWATRVQTRNSEQQASLLTAMASTTQVHLNNITFLPALREVLRVYPLGEINAPALDSIPILVQCLRLSQFGVRLSLLRPHRTSYLLCTMPVHLPLLLRTMKPSLSHTTSDICRHPINSEDDNMPKT